MKSNIEEMKDNLFWRLRNWILKGSEKYCITVGQIVDKVMKYAPKTLAKDSDAIKDVVLRLRSVDIDYPMTEWEQEDLNDTISYYYDITSYENS